MSEPSASSSQDGPSEGVSPQQPGPASASKPPVKELKQISLPSVEQIIQEDVMNNCVVKTILSGAMGGVAGLAFGLFTASIENSHGGMDGPMSIPDSQKTTRQILKEMGTNMKQKSLSFAKGFAVFGALYSFNECVIEKFRAKHDKVNPALAGCTTGAMLAYSAGPKAMCIGCASVGAFSIAIEYFLDH